MRALVLAAVIFGSSFAWAKPFLCEGRFGEKNPRVLMEVDPEENPLKSVTVSFQGHTTKYLLERLSLGAKAVSEYYTLSDLDGTSIGFRIKRGLPASFRFNRTRRIAMLMDLWADQSIRGVCR